MTTQMWVWIGCVVIIGFAVILLRRGIYNEPKPLQKPKTAANEPAQETATSAKR